MRHVATEKNVPIIIIMVGICMSDYMLVNNNLI